MGRLIVPTLLLLIAGVVSDAAAAQRGPLPDFTVTTSDGQTIGSSQLLVTGTWVVLYVRPACPLCESLLQAAVNERDVLEGRIAVIVGDATDEQLHTLASRYSTLPATAWHRDPGSVAFSRLGASGMPAAIGMRGRIMEWTLAGVLPDVRTLESVLRSWVTK